jgi:PEP-CTERM motif
VAEVLPVKIKISTLAISFCLLLASVAGVSASTVTYTFNAEVPTIDGLVPGGFTLTVPDFQTGTPMTQFMGSDFSSCSAPGTGECLAQFSVGPSPNVGEANDIGFGKDVCCFIYFFPDHSFDTPGTYTADVDSAAAATLTVSVNDAPEPSTMGLAAGGLSLVLFGLWKRRVRVKTA